MGWRCVSSLRLRSSSSHAFGFPVDHCAFGCRVIQALRDDAHFVARGKAAGLRCAGFLPALPGRWISSHRRLGHCLNAISFDLDSG